MSMKLVKKTERYVIYQRGDERFAVKDAYSKPINGDAKIQILLAEELIAAPKVAASKSEPQSDAADAPQASADAE